MTAVRVVRGAKSNKGKGIAYVEFQSRNDARMALGFDGHTLAGRAIRVTRVAAGPAAAEQQRGDSKLRTPYSKGETTASVEARYFENCLYLWRVGSALLWLLRACMCCAQG